VRELLVSLHGVPFKRFERLCQDWYVVALEAWRVAGGTAVPCRRVAAGAVGEGDLPVLLHGHTVVHGVPPLLRMPTASPARVKIPISMGNKGYYHQGSMLKPSYTNTQRERENELNKAMKAIKQGETETKPAFEKRRKQARAKEKETWPTESKADLHARRAEAAAAGWPHLSHIRPQPLLVPAVVIPRGQNQPGSDFMVVSETETGDTALVIVENRISRSGAATIMYATELRNKLVLVLMDRGILFNSKERQIDPKSMNPIAMLGVDEENVIVVFTTLRKPAEGLVESARQLAEELGFLGTVVLSNEGLGAADMFGPSLKAVGILRAAGVVAHSTEEK